MRARACSHRMEIVLRSKEAELEKALAASELKHSTQTLSLSNANREQSHTPSASQRTSPVTLMPQGSRPVTLMPQGSPVLMSQSPSPLKACHNPSPILSPSAIFSPSPSPPLKGWQVEVVRGPSGAGELDSSKRERETERGDEKEGQLALAAERSSWTSKRSSVNELKQAHLVRELTPLVGHKALVTTSPASSSSSVSVALSQSAANLSKSKVPDTITSDDEGSQEDSFQAFEGTLV